MTRALIIVALVLALGNAVQRIGLERAWARIDTLETETEACTDRVADILEDQASDREIEAIPDHGLRDAVDPRWLLPPGSP
jgi:hypothetical protein